MPKSYKQILPENSMSSVESFEYLLITFSSRIMIPSIQLDLRRIGCLKIMLMFCNNQVSSLNLNPIGNLWRFLKIRIRKRVPATINNLKTIYQEEWYKIPTYYCNKLIENYRKKLVAIEVNKGYPTMY